MNRHILAATDGSTCAHRALAYLAELYRDIEDVNVTLITVARPIPRYLQAGFSNASRELGRLDKLDEFLDLRETECRRILKAGKRKLVEAGFPQERIATKEIVQGQGIARDILMEARTGRYDAVLAGRRGLGNVAAYLAGSVSRELVEHGKNIPVWLADEPNNEPHHVLVAVDACELCLRVLDHAAFALSGMDRVRLTILHIIPRFNPFISSEEKVEFREIEKFVADTSENEVRKLLADTRDIFTDAGFDPSRVEIKIRRGSRGVAHDIMHEYRKGGYGTLVIGRRGIGGWEAVFPGSVSAKLMNSVDRGAIWIVE